MSRCRQCWTPDTPSIKSVDATMYVRCADLCDEMKV